ncbi:MULTISPECIES: hypothetical protein [Bacillaceae]|jgi:phage tail tape-measure protein|uniref:Glycine zipper family protein n=1 Tax=Ectobacillus funiculus TaxID=137993 RepID=A0ABV5WEF8_9BACI|nr:hypothetical protein [Ectobacillus funiculus]
MLKGAPLWSGVVAGGISQVEDVQSYIQGERDGKYLAASTVKNVTGAAGIMAGVEYGAIAGSMILPGIGTVIGSIAGYMVGNRIGSSIGATAGNLLFNRNPEQQEQ